MRDARDAKDALLLQNGDHAELLAAYFPMIRQRCLIKVRGDAGEDVAQNVLERLCASSSAASGTRFPSASSYTRSSSGRSAITSGDARPMSPLPEGWDVADEHDPYRPLEDDQALEVLFAPLPEGARRVLDLRYRQGLEPEEIAVELKIKRNAVDQALHRGHVRLRESISAG